MIVVYFDFRCPYIVFSLELETRLYYLSITITSATPPSHMGYSRRGKKVLKEMTIHEL